MQSIHIPEALASTMREMYGAKGEVWLRDLPTLLGEFERRWSLTILPSFPNLSYNYVAPAVRADGTPAVFKVGMPDGEAQEQIAALRLYDGRGIARLLESDAERGALLLERLSPGVSLVRLAPENDEAATAIAAEVMGRLWRPAPPDHPFPTTAHWSGGLERLRAEFGGGTGPFDARLIERAERLFAELEASAGPPMLLHGDLHHDNILSAEREPWMAIDPKGLAGEPAYEVGALLRNQLPRDQAEIRRLTGRRVDQLSEALGLDRERILGWSLAQAVLSGWWSYEDHGHGWEEVMTLAAAIDELMGG
jgi:streptomycin 6-kinase